MSRPTNLAPAQPGNALAPGANASKSDWKLRRGQRVAALLAELPFHDFSDWLRPDAAGDAASAEAAALARIEARPERIITDLGVVSALRDLDQVLDFNQGDLQILIDEIRHEDDLELTAGAAHGTAFVDASLTVTCSAEPGVHLLGGEQPALIVSAPGGIVTLRNVSLNADSRFGTVLVLDGHLRLEHCVISGRTGILLGPDAGNLEMIDSRIVCPMGGCGIVTSTDADITLKRVWIGVHRGIGILDLAGVDAPIGTAGLTVVGDDAVPLHIGVATP